MTGKQRENHNSFVKETIVWPQIKSTTLIGSLQLCVSYVKSLQVRFHQVLLQSTASFTLFKPRYQKYWIKLKQHFAGSTYRQADLLVTDKFLVVYYFSSRYITMPSQTVCRLPHKYYFIFEYSTVVLQIKNIFHSDFQQWYVTLKSLLTLTATSLPMMSMSDTLHSFKGSYISSLFLEVKAFSWHSWQPKTVIVHMNYSALRNETGRSTECISHENTHIVD
jgi:hypothetical protein